MSEEIKVTAHIQTYNPDACKFIVDAALLSKGTVFFQNAGEAQGKSPLAEKLFEISEVSSVRIAASEITVTRSGAHEWRPLAGKVAEVVRQHIRSGQPALSQDFKLEVPSDEDMKIKIRTILDSQINPAIAAHGGVVDLIDVKDGKVYVQMGGGCQGCGMANVTLRQGVEVSIREQVPQVAEILDVTDHASGTNPYYTPSAK